MLGQFRTGATRRRPREAGSARAARRFPALLFENRVVDPLAQRIGDVVLTAVGDHLAQVCLEVKGADTRSAFVEMHLISTWRSSVSSPSR